MTNMMRMFSFSLVLLLGLGLPVEQADAAKRFGGGSSFGKMFSTPKKAPAAPKSPSSTQTAPNKTTTPAAKPGMGGMLGGLLAGGLLGALFFGGAFEGIQMMDILLIALVAFVLFSLFKRPRPAQQSQYSPAGNARYEEPQQQAEPQQFQASTVLGGGLAEAELELPEWFNKEAFLQGATQHFETLQQAWSRDDLELIQSYCHPDFYQELIVERNKLVGELVDIEVVSVMAEIIGFQEHNGEAQLSVNFYGWLREGAESETTEFNEIWHLTRDTATEGADWFLVGIEQP